MKKQTLVIIPIMVALIAFAPIVTSAFAQEQTCSHVPADDLPGWSIETCRNGEITYINPDGKRCVPNNEESGITDCEGQTPMHRD